MRSKYITYKLNSLKYKLFAFPGENRVFNNLSGEKGNKKGHRVAAAFYIGAETFTYRRGEYRPTYHRVLNPYPEYRN
jgi:hypothetical protein